MKQIEFTISPTGKVSIETSGFSGGACLNAVKDVKSSLFGNRETQQQLKTEYYSGEPGLREPE